MLLLSTSGSHRYAKSEETNAKDRLLCPLLPFRVYYFRFSASPKYVYGRMLCMLQTRNTAKAAKRIDHRCSQLCMHVLLKFTVDRKQPVTPYFLLHFVNLKGIRRATRQTCLFDWWHDSCFEQFYAKLYVNLPVAENNTNVVCRDF